MDGNKRRTRDEGRGTRDEGRGMRDEAERRMRDEGRWTKDEGRRTRVDSSFIPHPSSLIPRPSLCIALFMATLLLAIHPAFARQKALSGLNTQDFQQKTDDKIQWDNNPFVQPANDVSVGDLKLAGLVFGEEDAAALINDQVLKKGDKIGRNEIVDINETHVILRNENGLYTLSVGSGASFDTLASGDEYNVEFKEAAVKSAIRLLAKMDARNVVVPDKMEGTITASFEKTKLIDALDSILRTHNYGYVEDNNILMVMDKKDMESGGSDLTTADFSLEYAKAEITLPHVQSLITGRGSAVADIRTNSIHVRDTKTAVGNITNLISKLDKKGKQVLIEAKIIDATSDFVRSLGIQWGVTKSGGNIQTAGLSSVGTADSGRTLMFNAPASSLNGAAPLGGVGMIIGSFKGILTDVQLSMAEQNGDVKVLSRPSIATMDNQAAKIRSGTKFYVKTNGNISIGGQGGTSTGSVGNTLQEIDTGIELNVTPQINNESFIQLSVAATQSEADFTKAIDGIPAVVDNAAQTTISLRDGETTIIGGLFHVRDAKTVKGIPGFMKVPIVGNLFKTRSKTKSKTELLIFLTPRIIESAVTSLPSFEEKDSIYNPETLARIEEEKSKKKKPARTNRRFR